MTNENKRIKQCTTCATEFEDKTRPGNRIYCSTECSAEARNQRRRIEYRKENPYKPTQREEFYYDHHEFPFWIGGENITRNQNWKTDVPYSEDKIESIISAREMYEYHGGRIGRHQEAINYNGDETGTHGTTVIFVESDRQPSDVTTYTMNPEELEVYIQDKK